jgi:hypothetical protein
MKTIFNVDMEIDRGDYADLHALCSLDGQVYSSEYRITGIIRTNLEWEREEIMYGIAFMVKDIRRQMDNFFAI